MKQGLWMPAEILDRKLSLIAKVIWSDIHSLSADGGKYYKANKTIAKEYGVSVSSVSRALQELHKYKLVKTVSFDGRIRVLSTTLTIQPPQIDKTESAKSEGSVTQNAKAASAKRRTKNTAKKTKKSTVEIVLPFDTDSFLDAWQMWISERKAKRLKNYTPRGEQTQLHNLQKISGNDEQTAINIIHQSIAQGWNGLFPLKNVRKQQVTQINIDSLNSFIDDGR